MFPTCTKFGILYRYNCNYMSQYYKHSKLSYEMYLFDSFA